MFMMLAHGITSAGMFFLVGVIYDRAHTRDLNKLGGLNNIMPLYGAISYLIFFGSMGLPGLCGFVAEVFVVLAAFNYSPLLAVLAAAAVILTAGYILWTLQRVFLGRSEALEGPARHEPPRDRHRRAPGGPDHRHGRLPAVAGPELDGALGRPDGRGSHDGPRAQRPARPSDAAARRVDAGERTVTPQQRLAEAGPSRGHPDEMSGTLVGRDAYHLVLRPETWGMASSRLGLPAPGFIAAEIPSADLAANPRPCTLRPTSDQLEAGVAFSFSARARVQSFVPA